VPIGVFSTVYSPSFTNPYPQFFFTFSGIGSWSGEDWFERRRKGKPRAFFCHLLSLHLLKTSYCTFVTVGHVQCAKHLEPWRVERVLLKMHHIWGTSLLVKITSEISAYLVLRGRLLVKALRQMLHKLHPNMLFLEGSYQRQFLF
jgi:hypothetical protein